MRKVLLTLLFAGVFVAPAMAEKPEWAGKGKPTDAQKAAHQTAMEAKGELDDVAKEKKDKPEKNKGLEKQEVKKSEQVQKELDRGSEEGKQARASNSKKWWKFWGE